MLFLIALGCTNPTIREVPPDAPVDLDAPLVRTTPIDEPVVYGNDIFIDAVIKDPSGVLVATLVYRTETAHDWNRVAMGEVGGDETNGVMVEGVIHGVDVYSGGLVYYIEAVDDSENENVGCAPIQCDEDPYRVSIIAPRRFAPAASTPFRCRATPSSPRQARPHDRALTRPAARGDHDACKRAAVAKNSPEG
jgi:hypothetical protein